MKDIFQSIYGFLSFIAGMKDIIQSYLWIFVLHRWYEGHYPILFMVFVLHRWNEGHFLILFMDFCPSSLE